VVSQEWALIEDFGSLFVATFLVRVYHKAMRNTQIIIDPGDG